jgi:hypothetical protein
VLLVTDGGGMALVVVVWELESSVVCDQAIRLPPIHTAIAAVAINGTKSFISLKPPLLAGASAARNLPEQVSTPH